MLKSRLFCTYASESIESNSYTAIYIVIIEPKVPNYHILSQNNRVNQIPGDSYILYVTE